MSTSRVLEPVGELDRDRGRGPLARGDEAAALLLDEAAQLGLRQVRVGVRGADHRPSAERDGADLGARRGELAPARRRGARAARRRRARLGACLLDDRLDRPAGQPARAVPTVGAELEHALGERRRHGLDSGTHPSRPCRTVADSEAYGSRVRDTYAVPGTAASRQVLSHSRRAADDREDAVASLLDHDRGADPRGSVGGRDEDAPELSLVVTLYDEAAPSTSSPPGGRDARGDGAAVGDHRRRRRLDRRHVGGRRAPARATSRASAAIRFKRNFGQHPAMHAGPRARPRRDPRDDGRRPPEPAGGHPAARRGRRGGLRRRLGPPRGAPRLLGPHAPEPGHQRDAAPLHEGRDLRLRLRLQRLPAPGRRADARRDRQAEVHEGADPLRRRHA